MQMMITLMAAVVLPFLILRNAKRIKLIDWLSPIVCCYALGILLGNTLGFIWHTDIAKTMSEVSVLVAIPLLLLSCDLLGWLKLARKTILSFVLIVFSVMTMSLIAGSIFKGQDSEVWKMAGMMVGVYTGGTPNLMAIGRALEISEEAFILVNSVDVVLGGIYLLFVMSVGVKIFSRFLPAFDYSEFNEGEERLHQSWEHFTLLKKIKNLLLLFLLAIVVVGVSLGLSHLMTGGESVSLIILSLTVISLGLSFNSKIRNFEGSQEFGQYLLLVFCVAVGSLANVSQIVQGSGFYFLFCGFIMFGSIILHFLCCFFLKIDRDTAIITSMAGIFGPAFVAPMAQVLKNRAILVSGITTGLVGYAVGNFAGLIVAYLLK